MDKSDLEVLLIGVSAQEVDQIHRVLHQWCVGPENSFPVQLALLTTAQWRIAAGIPRSVNDSRKLIEQHLAQYRQETAALIKNLATVATSQTEELKRLVAVHEKTVREANDSIHHRVAETEHTASELQARLKAGASHWEQAMKACNTERVKFQKTCEELDARLAWRNLLWLVAGLLGMLGIGIGIGLYIIH